MNPGLAWCKRSKSLFIPGHRHKPHYYGFPGSWPIPSLPHCNQAKATLMKLYLHGLHLIALQDIRWYTKGRIFSFSPSPALPCSHSFFTIFWPIMKSPWMATPRYKVLAKITARWKFGRGRTTALAWLRCCPLLLGIERINIIFSDNRTGVEKNQQEGCCQCDWGSEVGQ